MGVTAWLIDQAGTKAAQSEIAGITVAAPVPTRCTAGQSPARNCGANGRSQGEKRPSLAVYSRPHRVTYAVRVWLAP